MLNDDENYTANEVAEFLKLKSDRVHELARLGILPHFHLGRQLRFPGEQIRRFIESGGKPLLGGWRRMSSDSRNPGAPRPQAGASASSERGS
jgi:excisionase family DNA binding protein